MSQKGVLERKLSISEFYRFFLDFILIFQVFFRIYFLIKSRKRVLYMRRTRGADVAQCQHVDHVDAYVARDLVGLSVCMGPQV